MIVVIDTSSLLSLVRYYLPFDKESILAAFIEKKILSKEIVVIDKVYEECKYVAKGMVIKELAYLAGKSVVINTIDLLPSSKFFNQLENQFINASAKRRLTAVEYENRKDSFLESADAKLLLYCGQQKQRDLYNEIVLVTEESESNNDLKAFKKLPVICKMLSIETLTLPQLLVTYPEINLQFK